MATSKISTASKQPTAAYVPPSTYALRGDGVTKNRLPWLLGSSILLSSTALTISGYLSYVAFTSSKVAGCGGGLFDCDHVLHSKWSTMLGLPVAAWASSLYLSVLAALIVTAKPAVSPEATPVRQWTWSIVTAAGVAAGLAALWFIYLQVFVLEHLCPWCLGAHTCGILLCLSTLAFSPLSARVKGLCASLGFVATLGLVVIQLLTPQPPTFTTEEFSVPAAGSPADDAEMFDAPGEGDEVFLAPDAQASLQVRPAAWATGRVAKAGAIFSLIAAPQVLLVSQVADDKQADDKQADDKQADDKQEEAKPAAPAKPAERTVHLSGANVKLRPNQWPILGSPDAPHVFVELFDYTCQHCRATQRAIKGAREKMGDQLAVIVLPVPLSRQCNDTVNSEHAGHRESCEISKIALALWKADASKFAEYHEWLMATPSIPTAAQARTKAIEMVGEERLNAEMGAAAKYIPKHVDIYRRLGAGPVPKLVFPATVLTGEMTSVTTLVETINRQPKQ